MNSRVPKFTALLSLNLCVSNFDSWLPPNIISASLTVFLLVLSLQLLVKCPLPVPMPSSASRFLVPPPVHQKFTSLLILRSPTHSWPSFSRRPKLHHMAANVDTLFSALKALWSSRPRNCLQSTSHLGLSPKTRHCPKTYYSRQVLWIFLEGWRSTGRSGPLLYSLECLLVTHWFRCCSILQEGTGMTSRFRTSFHVWGCMLLEMFGRSKLPAGFKGIWRNAWPNWISLPRGLMLM